MSKKLLSTALLILISFFIARRLTVQEKIHESAADPLSQLGYALLSFKQRSLHPVLTSYQGIMGGSYYPIGFYWICFELLRKSPRLVSLIPCRSNVLSNLLRVDGTEAQILDKGISLIKVISGLISPLIAYLLTSIVFVAYSDSTLAFSVVAVRQ